MYTKQLKTIEGNAIYMVVPENPKELPAYTAIAVLKYLNQQTGDMTMSPFGVMSVILNKPVDDLYSLLMPDQVDEGISHYADAILRLTSDPNYLTTYKPRSVKVRHPKHRKRLLLRVMNMEPAGAYIEASKIIESEIQRHQNLFGDNWQNNFNPSFESMAGVVDQFLYCRVKRRLWQRQKPIDEQLSKYINFADMIYIAGYFFRKYPELNTTRSGIDKLLFNLKMELITIMNFRQFIRNITYRQPKQRRFKEA